MIEFAQNSRSKFKVLALKARHQNRMPNNAQRGGLLGGTSKRGKERAE